MSGYGAWAKKQRGNPIWLFLGVSGIAAGCYIGFSKIWAPFSRRRKLEQAKIYADYIYDQETKRKSQ